jgi:hypothetical protein
MTKFFDQGTVVTIETVDPATGVDAPFRKKVGGVYVPLDPDVVKFVCEKPDDTFIRATWTKGSGDPSSTIVHDGATDSGMFHVDVIGDVGSTTTAYNCRMYSTGNGQTSYRLQFYIKPDSLV